MRVFALAALIASASPSGCPGELPAGATELESTGGWAGADPVDEDEPPVEPGGGSDQGTSIQCGDEVETDTRSDALATSQLDAYECNVGNYAGAERSWTFSPTESGEATFRLLDPRPMELDQDVMILADDGRCLTWGANSVDFAVDAGHVYRLVIDGYDGDVGAARAELECDLASVADAPPTEAGCPSYDSTETESAPIQVTGEALPASATAMAWTRPAASTNWVDFAGVPGQPATHEGIDYIHDDEADAVVDVLAAADGVVAYVRTGCPESGRFEHNTQLRECGSGWGNHVIVEHGDGVYTRYGHLALEDVRVRVGDAVLRGEAIAGMGNSGRSETRHLHFELGTRAVPFDSCAPTESFDAVYPPGPLGVAP